MKDGTNAFALDSHEVRRWFKWCMTALAANRSASFALQDSRKGWEEYIPGFLLELNALAFCSSRLCRGLVLESIGQRDD